MKALRADLVKLKTIERNRKYITVPRPVCWLLAGGYLIAFGYLLGMYGR